MPKRSKESCFRMAGDIQRIAGIQGDLRSKSGFAAPRKFVAGKRFFGTSLGPTGNEIHYDVACVLPRNNGKSCASFEIRRSGPGAKGLKKRADVGNERGLTRQLARDAARVWGCPPAATRGFEGPRRRKPRKRRSR